MKNPILIPTLFIFLLGIPHFALAQDSLTVNKKRMDKIIRNEFKKSFTEYKNEYEAGHVTWNYPIKVGKKDLISVDLLIDGKTFFILYYNTDNYEFIGCVDWRL